MKLKFLFWNVRDKDEKTLGAVLDELMPSDVICVAESQISDSYFQSNGFTLIHKIAKRDFRKNEKKVLKLYAKASGFIVNAVGDYGNGEMIAALVELSSVKILIVGVHLISKLSVDNEEKKLKNAIRYRNFIESLESKHNSSGSIVFGDFNANPFEKTFTATEGLFGIDLLKPPPRRIKKFPYFINPTISQIGHFNHFSDGRQKPPGSYYYHQKDFDISCDLFWNAFDGLIFRPSLLNSYLGGSPLEVISKTPNHELFDFTEYKINLAYSDHLPITFTFKF